MRKDKSKNWIVRYVLLWIISTITYVLLSFISKSEIKLSGIVLGAIVITIIYEIVVLWNSSRYPYKEKR